MADTKLYQISLLQDIWSNFYVWGKEQQKLQITVSNPEKEYH